MMSFRNTFILLVSLLFLNTNCTPKKGKKDFKTTDKTYSLVKKKYDDFCLSIDSRKDLIEVSSLCYSDSKGNIVQVKGLVDENFSIVKLTQEESFVNGKLIEMTYYFSGSEKIYSSRKLSIFKKENCYFHEEASCYSDNKKIIYSGKRFSFDEYKLAKKKFHKIEPVSHNDFKAKQIINQKENFQTNFQGFMEMQGRNYLIVGTEKFSSSIAFQEYKGNLKLLKSNEKSFEGKLLKVEFEIITEPNGFTFQALRSVSFVN